MKKVDMIPPSFTMPPYMKNCPVVFDWVTYNGKNYFAALNFEKSEVKQRPILDLHYCATAALNGNLIEKTITYTKRVQLAV